ncbi:hypothetical protein [Umezawaea tangerina]|uniref:Uncharacterized protein n=1 Tax=Umezawaea tangerina TaxID=84725 RepID=A0A2T0SZS0_9PSEU|nr:hypothetical protein [Umezawaea tangerina]PRY38853.1 hypothetical protein CLV43_108253 [Umezawaea tangerina]
MTEDHHDEHPPTASNSATELGQSNVVQSGSIGSVNFNPTDKRVYTLLGAILLVALIGASAIVWAVRSHTGQVKNDIALPPASQTANATAPIAVESVAYLENRGNHDFVFPDAQSFSSEELAELDSKKGDGKGYVDWVLAHGGVYPNAATIQVGLRGTGRETLNITDVKIVKQCREPLTGTLLYSPTAGPTGSIAMYFDLDADYPVALDGREGSGYFTGTSAQTIQLVPGEVATLLINVATSKSYCAFHFDLTVNPGDGQPTLTKAVDNAGRPFEVSAMPTTDSSPTAMVAFDTYQAIYAGGVASRTGKFVAADPKSFKGTG